MHVHSKDLVRWVKLGRLIHIGYGVYRTTQYPPSSEDQFAAAVEEVGASAYLCGESVLALHGLAETNANYIHIASPVRVRRRLPSNYVVTKGAKGYKPEKVRGIRSQSVADAIRSCKGLMMADRLENAANEAYRLGLLDKSECASIVKELYHGPKATKK